MERSVVNTQIGGQYERADCRGTVCRPVSERSLVTGSLSHALSAEPRSARSSGSSRGLLYA